MRRVFLVAICACLPIGACFADVVPPRAVEVAEAWLALTDRGRVAEAVDRWFDAPTSSGARALVARATKGAVRPPRIVSRTIRSWTGYGEGDSSRMAPGAYFALVFETRDAAGRPGTQEVRLVPRGDGDWRVVGEMRGEVRGEVRDSNSD